MTIPARTLLCAALLAATLSPLAAAAAEPTPRAQSADAEAAQGPAPGQQTDAAEPGEDPSAPDVFVPTEEISEDFAVSFPVDI